MYTQVIDSFPKNYENMVYVEPFVGGGSVFFNKEPSEKEIINDSDSELISLYKLVKKYPEELQEIINGHYTKKDFLQIKEFHPVSDIGKIIRKYILTLLSFMARERTFQGDDNKIRKVEKDFKSYSDRLSSVIILNKDYKKVIHDYDSPNTFFYLDPPYEDTNKTLSDYSDIDFDELFRILSSIKGKFLMSVNNSKRIRDLFKGFYIKKATTIYRLKHRKVVELLISNYPFAN